MPFGPLSQLVVYNAKKKKGSVPTGREAVAALAVCAFLVSFTPRSLYPQQSKHLFPLNMWFCGAFKALSHMDHFRFLGKGALRTLTVVCGRCAVGPECVYWSSVRCWLWVLQMCVCVCHRSLTHSDWTLSSQCVSTFCVILTTNNDHLPHQDKPVAMCTVEALCLLLGRNFPSGIN